MLHPWKLAAATGVALLLGLAGSPAAQPAPPPRYTSTILIFDLATKSATPVFRGEGIWEAPNWSRDGRFLLVNAGGKLYRLFLDRPAAPEPLLVDPALRCNNDHDYSPDGTRLAISASTATSRGSQIYVADADGTNARLVVAAPDSYFHGWSPDGTFLSFVARRDGRQFDLYRVPARGGDEERLTSHPAHEDGTDYSPDGRWIYFNSDRAGGGDIWRMPAGGAGPDDHLAQRVTADALEDWFPHPSPDGRHLLFLSFPAGTKGHNDRTLRVQLRLLPLPGETPDTSGAPVVLTELTGGQGTINVNSWSPDSKRFAYVSYGPAAAPE